MLATGARMVVQVEPSGWEPGLVLRGWLCICTGLGGRYVSSSLGWFRLL